MSIADDKAVLEEGTAFSPKFDAAGLIVAAAKARFRMVNFIKLEDVNGRDFYVNPDHVMLVGPVNARGDNGISAAALGVCALMLINGMSVTVSDTIENVASSVTDPDVEEPGRRPRFLTLRRFIPS